MPVFPGLPEVKISMHVSHEEWDGVTGSDVVSPAVNQLELGEHNKLLNIPCFPVIQT
jgi:hypothetical protein